MIDYCSTDRKPLTTITDIHDFLQKSKANACAGSGEKVVKRKNAGKGLKRVSSSSCCVIMSPEEESKAIKEADRALDSAFLRYARHHPKDYLRILGHILVMTELVAIMTPSVAMGIQWVTALCDGPPVYSIIELLTILYRYVITGDFEASLQLTHCILKR